MAGSFPEKGGPIYAIYGDDGLSMAKSLLEAANVAQALKKGANIVLKPNLVVAKTADSGATTHPEIVAGCIEYLKEHGHDNIDIIEGSWLGDDTVRAFSVCGMAEVGKHYGVQLYDLKKDATVTRDTPIGPVKVCKRALEADFIINLPVVKGHCQTRLTCAIKNMKGCIPDSEKRRFHRDGLDEWIGALATAIMPSVTIADGLCGDLDFEEGGNPVPADRMFLCADPVKLDAYACSLIGLPVEDVEYIGLAKKYGMGETAIREGDVKELNQPTNTSPIRQKGKVAKLAARLQSEQACSACFANAIHALKRLEENGITSQLPKLYIGQGWQGKELDGVGIGKCCKGAEVNIPGCPPTATDILDALFE